MFGLNEALMSFVRRQVGLRTDAANSAGSLHAKIKALAIKHNYQIFTENGTFVVPDDVTTVYITAIAAGNNGTAGTGGPGSDAGFGGAGGAAGQQVLDKSISGLTPGSSIAVTVGTGNTVFGSHLTLVKGAGVTGASGEGPGGLYNSVASGGGGGKGAGGFGSGGGGGGGSGGHSGGNGRAGGGGSGFGSGGGGGGGSSISGSYGVSYTGGAGGAGAPGLLIVRWL